jgi:hypothetical protein
VNIGLIGSGKVGKALGAWIAKCGFPVAFASRKKEDARAAASAAAPRARALDIRSVVRESDLILLTLPYEEIVGALKPVEHGLEDKILVDVSNPVSKDRSSLIVGQSTAGAEEISSHFPMARTVKAFNTVFAEVYAKQQPQINDHPISIFFAGDDTDAKSSVRELIERMGFDAVDAGPLRNARCLEPLSLLNIQLGRKLGLGTNIGFRLLRPR